MLNQRKLYPLRKFLLELTCCMGISYRYTHTVSPGHTALVIWVPKLLWRPPIPFSRFSRNILNAKVTSSAYLFFRLDERLYHDFYFDYIFIGNERPSDGINGKPRVNWVPWSFSDIFCIHNISSTKSIANQSLSITAILSRHGTRRSGTLQDKTAAWSGRSIPYELDQPIIVSSRKVPPHKGTKEAQRDKTKSCCTGLTCQHNNTKSWYCYNSLLLTI